MFFESVQWENLRQIWFQFLASLHLMDYSLLVGIHDCDQAETEQQNDSFENDEDEEGGAGEEEDSPGSGGDAGAGGGGLASNPTPPDSPLVNFSPPMFSGELDPSMEFFAIKSSDR